MLVVGDNILSICSDSIINKLVVINISGYQPEMNIDLLIKSRAQPGNSLNYIMGVTAISSLYQERFFS